MRLFVSPGFLFSLAESMVVTKRLIHQPAWRNTSEHISSKRSNPQLVQHVVLWRFYLDRILKPVICTLAAIYFLVDAIFMTVARPLANWIAEYWIFRSLRVWIGSLRPYPALALLAVPVIVLEPVKPAAARATSRRA